MLAIWSEIGNAAIPTGREETVDQAAFVSEVRTMVTRNARRTRRRALLRHLRERALAVGVVWSAIVVAAFWLVVFPAASAETVDGVAVAVSGLDERVER